MRPLLLTLLALSGCGSSVSAVQATADGGAPSQQAPLADAGPDSTDGDAAAPPIPGQVLAGNFKLIGVTSDDQIIALALDAPATNAVVAIPIAGGAARTIAAASTSVALSGQTVFIWNGQALTVWSTARGTTSLTTTATQIPSAHAPGVFAATPDGATVVFADTLGIQFARLDGSLRATAASDLAEATDYGFCVSSAYPFANRILVQLCADDSNGGVERVLAFDVASGASRTLVPRAAFFGASSIDARGEWIAVLDDTSQGLLVRTDGTSSVGFPSHWPPTMSPDGTRILSYASQAQGMILFSTTDLTATPVPMPVDELGPTSPSFFASNGRYLAWGVSEGWSVAPVSNLAKSALLTENQTSWWTATSSHLLVGERGGTLAIMPLEGGPIARVAGVDKAIPAAGTKVILESSEELRVLDLATNGTVTIAHDAYTDAVISPDLNHLVFNRAQIPGIYVFAIE